MTINTDNNRIKRYHMTTWAVVARDAAGHGHNDAQGIEWTTETAHSFLNDDDFECPFEPPAPLSGEFAGDLTPQDIARTYLELDPADMTDDDHVTLQEYCDAYESAYYEGYYERAEQDAHEFLEGA